MEQLLNVIPPEWWAAIISVVVIQLAILAYALVRWNRVKNEIASPKLWLAIILFVNFGSIVFLFMEDRLTKSIDPDLDLWKSEGI